MKPQLKTFTLAILLTFIAISLANAQDEVEESNRVSKKCSKNIVYVFGTANGDKILGFDTKISMLEALEKSGGLPKKAKVRFVFLYRRIDDNSFDRNVFKYKLKDLTKIKIEDPILKPCDVVEFRNEKERGRGELVY